MKAKSLVLTVLLALVNFAFAANRQATYSLPDAMATLTSSIHWPERSYISIDDGNYIQPYEPEGAPTIPYRILKFAIPDGYQVESVQSEGITWTRKAEKVQVMPIQPPIPTNTPEETVPEFVELDPKFLVDAPYPAAPVEKLETYTQGGINLLSVKVTPFRWNPMSGL